MNGKTWLPSGPTYFYADGTKYSSADGSLKLAWHTGSTGVNKLGDWNSTDFVYYAGKNEITASIKTIANVDAYIFTQVSVHAGSGDKAHLSRDRPWIWNFGKLHDKEKSVFSPPNCQISFIHGYVLISYENSIRKKTGATVLDYIVQTHRKILFTLRTFFNNSEFWFLSNHHINHTPCVKLNYTKINYTNYYIEKEGEFKPSLRRWIFRFPHSHRQCSWQNNPPITLMKLLVHCNHHWQVLLFFCFNSHILLHSYARQWEEKTSGQSDFFLW